jgi:hypothetical protein
VAIVPRSLFSAPPLTVAAMPCSFVRHSRWSARCGGRGVLSGGRLD